MKNAHGDTPGNRDGGGRTATRSEVDWLANASLEDCRLAAINASLPDLIAAFRILLLRPNTKTRRGIIAKQMRQRFGVSMGSDELIQRKGRKA